MTVQRLAAVTILALLACARPVSAQDARGFIGGGTAEDGYSNAYPSFGGGFLMNVGQPWVSAGAQADGFVSWPYFAGRGALFAQGNLLPKGVVRPFVLAGGSFGEMAGPMLGGGIEIRPAGSSIGFRVSVEDYVQRYRGLYSPSSTINQLSVRAAVVFR